MVTDTEITHALDCLSEMSSLCAADVSGCQGAGLAGGGGGAANSASCACSAMPETLQLLQPLAVTWRHG